uniref:Uncharacterized protein n=1 Tax=Solanum lycopersicum TaxID=4081 RepID=K4C8R9_SOLLC
MVSPKKSSGSRPPTENKKSSSSPCDKSPPSQRPKANDDNVDPFNKSMSPSQTAKFGGNNSTGKVDGATIGKTIMITEKAMTPVTQGKRAGTKKPWCRLISEFPQNPSIEISESRFMAGASKKLSENAMDCVIRRGAVIL